MHVFDQSCATVESRPAPAGRADGRAALRPPGHHGVRRRQAAGRAAQRLRHLGRRHRRADAGGRGRRDLRARAQGRARARRRSRRRAPPGRRALGLCHDPARASSGRRSCATPTRRPSPACCSSTGSMPRQPPLRRAHRGDQSLRRDSDPRPRLLLPRLDRPDALRRPTRSSRRRASIRAASSATVAAAVRMLDNVLTATVWPLPEQAREARQAADRPRLHRARRRADHARPALRHRRGARGGGRPTRRMRDAAYRASVALAREKGASRSSRPSRYLGLRQRPAAAEDIRAEIGAHGTRNSHLLSIAPTGTISLAFADSRLERHRAGLLLVLHPPEARAGRVDARVPGRGPRLAAVAGARRQRPAAAGPSSTRSRFSARDHMAMQAAIQPYIDAAISKTRERAGGLSLRGLRGSLPRGLARG